MTGKNVVRAVSTDTALLPHIGELLTQLTHDYVWLEVGDSVADVVEAASGVVDRWYGNMMIGSVYAWIITPPAGWLLLDGSTYATADYPELALLLPAHLISGANFILPDVEDAFPYGVVSEDDAAVEAGANMLNLTVGQLPAHTHTYTPPVLTVEAETPTTPLPTAGIGSPIATGSTGSGDDIDKRPRRFGMLYAVYAGRE